MVGAVYVHVLRSLLLGSPAFPLYLFVRDEGRRRIVGDAAARAGRYAGGGERDWVYRHVQFIT